MFLGYIHIAYSHVLVCSSQLPVPFVCTQDIWFNAPLATATYFGCSLLLPQWCACMPSHFHHVWLFVTLWTVAVRPLCPWDSPGEKRGLGYHALLHEIVSAQGSNSSLCSSCIAGRFFPTEPLGNHWGVNLSLIAFHSSQPSWSLGSISCMSQTPLPAAFWFCSSNGRYWQKITQSMRRGKGPLCSLTAPPGILPPTAGS